MNEQRVKANKAAAMMLGYITNPDTVDIEPDGSGVFCSLSGEELRFGNIVIFNMFRNPSDSKLAVRYLADNYQISIESHKVDGVRVWSVLQDGVDINAEVTYDRFDGALIAACMYIK